MTKTMNILIVSTSAADMGTSGEPTGLWLEELTTPWYAFLDAGANVTLASIRGGAIPIDPRSLGEDAMQEASVKRYNDDAAARAAVANSPALESIDHHAFDAVFLPGGHGTMFDFADSAALATVVSDTLAGDRILASVCHGPAGLVSALTEDGVSVVKGRKVTGFADTEEVAVGLDEKVPFLLETRLRALGANYHKGPDFKSFAVEDGNLITGQNPASAGDVAKRVIAALRRASAGDTVSHDGQTLPVSG